MSTAFLRKALTPTRVTVLLSLLTVGCAVLIAHFTMGQASNPASFAARAQRLQFVEETVNSADHARETLREYEVTQSPADKAAFIQACDVIEKKVSTLRQSELMSEEETDQIVDLCIAIRQQLNKIDASPEDRMSQAGLLLDRIRRVVLGFGMDEVRAQDLKIEEQTKAAALHRNLTAGMAVIEILLVLGIVFLVVRLARLEQLITVCAWSHRLLYEGQWVSLERYLESRFNVRASEGITTEQAAQIMSENAANGEELIRLVEFEKAAAERAKEAARAIHAVRNHLTAVLCYSEMAGSGDAEAQAAMANRVVTHANTISSQVDLLQKTVRAIHPAQPDFHIVATASEKQPAA
jgi:hypothetical protein